MQHRPTPTNLGRRGAVHRAPGGAAILSLMILVSCGGRFGAPAPPPAPPPPVLPPATPAAPPELPGLLSAIGGAGGTARVDWGPAAEETAPHLALFRGDSPGDVYAGPPLAEDLVGDHVLLTGEADDSEPWFGLAARETPTDPWTPVGEVLRARVASPILVDASSTAASPDGATPATAFASLQTALIAALALGGRSVWIAQGELELADVVIPGGLHLAGGFGPTFELATRDPIGQRTVLRGSGAGAVLRLTPGPDAVVLDGLEVDGASTTPIGVDADDRPIELRRVDIGACLARGLRVRGPQSGDALAVSLISCSLSGNGGEGMSSKGAVDCAIDACAFENNAREGADFDDLIAPEGRTARVRVRGSRFVGNGFEGLDLDLATPPLPGLPGGRFEVSVRGSRFEENGLDGLLIDHDFEAALAWEADLSIVGCTARANGAAGVRLDLDAFGPAFVHRLVASANRAEGLLIGSESLPGTAVVSSSVLAGNFGAGLRTTGGNRAMLVSHSIVAGNFDGGVAADTLRATALSSIVRVQSSPWKNVVRAGSPNLGNPLVQVFERAPRLWARGTKAPGGAVALDPDPHLPADATVELDDDGVLRIPSPLGSGTYSLEPKAPASATAVSLGSFVQGTFADEDWRLAVGSPAAGDGHAPPGAPAVDAGPWGAPLAGAPGSDDPVPGPLFRLAGRSPELVPGPGNHQPVELSFAGGVPDPSSLLIGVVRGTDGGGAELPVDVSVVGDALVVAPPIDGWQTGDRVELNAGLTSLDGAALATPVLVEVGAP